MNVYNMDSTVQSLQPHSGNSKNSKSVESQSHYSILLDVTSEKPMFPDAIQDNYVKSISSSENEAISMHQKHRTARERFNPHTIPPYVSTIQDVGESRTGGFPHIQMASTEQSQERSQKREYMQNKSDRLFSPGSSMQPAISEGPIPSRRHYGVDQCDSRAHSEPIISRYSDHDFNRKNTSDHFYHNRKNQREKCQTDDLKDPYRKDYIHEQQQNRNINLFHLEDLSAKEQQHFDFHQFHNNNYSDSDCRLMKKDMQDPHHSSSFECERNCSVQTPIDKSVHSRRYHRSENCTSRNQARCSFDDNSTIPSQEWMENHLPMQRNSSVPNSIKVAEEESRQNFSRKPNSQSSRNLHDYTAPSKMRSSHAINNLQEAKKSFSSSENRQSYMNIQQTMKASKDLEFEHRNIVADNMDIPAFQVVGSSQGTQTTALCSSMGSGSISESDRYLHCRKLGCNSTNNISRHKEANPIPTQSNPSQPYNLSSVKTPTSSNTSTHIIRPESKGTSSCRLEILQEISMAMDMRKKAKLSQETEDYNFWVNHINKLNKELEAMKFEHTRKDSNTGKIVKDSVHCKKQSSTTCEQNEQTMANTGRKSSTNDEPVSILRNSKNKTRTIKIRAPSDLEAGHIFSVNVKGEEIKAAVVSM